MPVRRIERTRFYDDPSGDQAGINLVAVPLQGSFDAAETAGTLVAMAGGEFS